MERSIGSMGSEYTRFRVDPEAVPLLAKFDWNSIARRVFIDPAGGLVALMTPSSKHERYAWGTGRLMDAMDRAGIPVVALGSTRWRRPEDPENTGAEPDACYYLGETAEHWGQAYEQGEGDLGTFELHTPPNLVIEVERSSGDEDRPAFYRRLGVPEMWRLDISGNTREATMLDLQAPGGPAELASSNVLLRATPSFVLNALELAVRRRLAELDALIGRQVPRETGGPGP